MDLVRLNSRPQCHLSIVLVALTVLLGLCGRSMSQISGSHERIGCVVVNMTSTCFDIYNTSLTWSNAWSQCLANGSQLALLRTPETDLLVGQYMDRITENFEDEFSVWIGGRELGDSSWNWTDGTSFVMQNTSTISTLFSTQVNRYENCATVGAQQTDSTLIFQSSQCKSPRQFICQEPNTTSTTTTCDIAGNGGTVINGSCYAIIASAALSWFDARYKCETLGADLAVFDETSSSDSSAIYSLLPNATLFWIGLRKNPWIWVKGFDTGANAVTRIKEISYSGWESDVPFQRGRSCLGMDGRSGVSHGWVNLKCEESHSYICQEITILTTTAAPTTAALTTAAPTTPTTAFYDYGSDFTPKSDSPSPNWNIVNIVVPIVIVAVVILVIGFIIYCYFAQRRVGYIQTQ